MSSSSAAHLLVTAAQFGQLRVSTPKRRKLTLAAVAIRGGSSQNRISYLEKHPDEISIKQLFSWCSVLALDLQPGQRDTSAVNETVEW